MKVLLTLALLLPTLLSQPQTTTQDGSVLEVVKFGWTKYSRGSGVIHGVDDPPVMNGPIASVKPQRRNEPESVRNNRDLAQRSADLRSAERDAAQSASTGHDFYLYRLQIRNVGAKLVKTFVWEYLDSPDSRGRQFLCRLKAKANETKGIEVFSPFAPSKVINAADKKVQAPQKDKVTINRIEFDDGSIWQRTGWEPSILDGQKQKYDNGKCVAL